MNIDSRSLQRKNQLRQSLPPEDLMEHRHSYWRHQDYQFRGADTGGIASLVYIPVGQVVRLDPVVLMYATEVVWYSTVTFPGGGDTFTLKLDLGYEEIEETCTATYVHELIAVDVSEYFIPFFKTFAEVDAEMAIKVSNVATSVKLWGSHLRFTLWERDSFGDYAKPTARLLTEPYLTQKDVIQRRDKLSDEFTYLSGVRL